MTPKTNEDWIAELKRQDFYKDVCLCKEAVNWLRTLLTEKDKQKDEAVAEALKELWEMGKIYETIDTRSAVYQYACKHHIIPPTN